MDPIESPIDMPQLISWSALADASGQVGVWGLGVEGGASLRRLRAMGHVPVLVDDRPGAPTLDGIEVLATDRGGLDALMACEVVVKGPGISRYRPEVAELEAAAVAVCGGLGLFMAEADLDRVVCVTGTKGKSTTTVLAVHLLRGLGVKAEAGGNIGRPPWDLSDEPDPDYWVIETSSFQIPDLPVASRVVAVTSLAPDHLDWHGTVERYYADKLSLCTKPNVELVLANGTDERLRAEASRMGPHVRWVSDADGEHDAAWSDELGLRVVTTRAMQRCPARSCWPSGSPVPTTTRGCARQPLGSPGCPAAAGRWAPSVRSSSSTTVSRPTSSRPKRLSTPSTGCPWRSWWAGTTVASTTRHSHGRWLGATCRPSWSPCPTTGPASAPPSAPRRPSR